MKILNLEIYDLNRTLETILKELAQISWNLANTLPMYFWHNILIQHARPFENSRLRLSRSHEKKFCWLKDSWERKHISKIKPIKFTYVLNKHEHFKVIKFMQEAPVTSSGESLLNINITPTEFSLSSQASLNNNNHKWFINLTNTEIPPQVSCLLQHGEKFSLPINLNKKNIIHEFIKDMEGNTNRINIHNQIKIRNIATAQLNKFLHKKTQKNIIDINILSMVNSTVEFMHNNPEVTFTRTDKGNVTVALNRNVYVQKIEELLHDKKTYSLIKRNPASSIKKNLNDTLKKMVTSRVYFQKRLLSPPFF